MDKEAHNKTKALNKRLLLFILDMNEALKGDPELKEINRDLLRVSKFLNLKSTKSIYDENNKT